MKWRNSYLALIVFNLTTNIVVSQNHRLPLNHTFNAPLEAEIIKSSTAIFTTFKPYREVVIDNLKPDIELNSLYLFEFNRSASRNRVSRKLFHDHFIELDTGKVKLSIDPLINFEAGRDQFATEDNLLYKNTRGFMLLMEVGDRLAIGSTFRENQAELPEYVAERTFLSDVAFGQGRIKTFKEDGFDFAMASSYISYNPTKRLNIQLGHGKHFIGEGYRSHLLSDLSFNYPFIKINTSWLKNRLQYQSLFTMFQDLNRLNNDGLSENIFERKAGVIHFLEYSISPRFYIGLFEAATYSTVQTNSQNSAPLPYFIPIIGANSLIATNDSTSSQRIGLNLKLNDGKNLQLYAQFMKELNNDNQGAQLGARLFFLRDFLFQLELNNSNSAPSLFSHYSESLTTPIYESHQEVFSRLQFTKNRWVVESRVNHILTENEEYQIYNGNLSFIINPTYRMTITAGAQYRTLETFNQDKGSLYYFIGLRTNLQNLYFDY